MKRAPVGTKNIERRDTRRRFEQWAQNPSCEANTVSAVYGLSMSEVAKAEGLTPTMGQSPFAIARGDKFERSLFRSGAAVMRKALIEAGVIPDLPVSLIDLRLRRSGGKLQKLDDSLEETSKLFRRIGASRPTSRNPLILAGATVRIPGGIMLPEAILILDVLVVRYDAGTPTLIVGEVKSYPDRGGHTDSTQLATARAQAGVYVHGLQLVLEDLGLSEQFTVSMTGFLVLTKPGFNIPSVRANEDLRFQAKRAQRGFERLRDVAAQLKPPATIDVNTIIEAATAYDEVCVSFCDRATLCHRRALECGNPAALGSDVPRFVNGIDLHRAADLVRDAKPANLAESDFVARVKEVKQRIGLTT